MPAVTIRVRAVGDQGLILDPPAHALPPNAWNGGLNIRFREGSVQTDGGSKTLGGTLQVSQPHHLEYLNDYWLYAGGDGAGNLDTYLLDNTYTHYDIQSATDVPAYTTLDKFTGGVVNGLPVIAHNNDHPIYWPGGNPSTVNCAWLPWDSTPKDWSTENWKARAIRPHRRWLFALGPTEGSTDYPYRIRNSAAAPPNAIPASWDDTDTTNDAAFIDDLQADLYPLVDGCSLANDFVVCTEQTTWIGSSTGDNDQPFIFRKAFNVGAMTNGCLMTYERQQFILTPDDLVVHDGHSMRSILDERARRWLFAAISSQWYERAFLALSRATHELLVCFPSTDSTWCDRALTVRLTDYRLGYRHLPDISDLKQGDDFSAGTDYNFEDIPWAYNMIPVAYAANAIGKSKEDRVGIAPGSTTGLKRVNENQAQDADTDTTSEGKSKVQRDHVTLESQDESVYLLRSVRPIFTREPTGSVTIGLGAANSAGGTINYTKTHTYDSSTTTEGRVNTDVSGRSFGIYIESAQNVEWALSGYDLELVPIGFRRH